MTKPKKQSSRSRKNKKQDTKKRDYKKILLKQTGGKQPPSFWMHLATVVLIAVAAIAAYSLVATTGEEREDVAFSELAGAVKQGQVSEIVVEGDDLKANYEDGTKVTSKKEVDASLTETLKNYGVTPAQLEEMKIDIQRESGIGYWLVTLAPILIPLLFIGFFIWFLSRQVRGAGMQAFSFGQSKARVSMPDDKTPKVTFKDVAGAEEAKQELEEVVDFLKNPKKFLKIGAQIPKGMLMMGPPGSGKTLLARSVAGEAGVPFFSISGSEFIEMFVGVGASRVRDLFKMAKTSAPAIIFIDEIDAIGRIRGSGMGGGHDEREQTLNQILVEMDGFEPNEQVIVLAATNRPDVLDPALLRPGRFDRRVTIDLPDRKDRVQILEVQARKKPLASDVDFNVVAQRTPGFSGADLYSLVNEAAILAARDNRKEITQDDLIKSIEKVMLGPKRRSHVLTKREKEITAYHEAGHALVASALPYSDPVHKISVISRGRAAGYTLKLPSEDKKLRSRREFVDDMASTLGGYAAEKLVFGDITTGPSNDLQVVTATARNMVTRYGMSDTLGPVALESESGNPLYGHAPNDREYSEKVSAQVDAEVSRMVDDALTTARDILEKHRDALDHITRELIRVETLEQDEYEAIIKQHGIEPKHKEEEVGNIHEHAVEEETHNGMNKDKRPDDTDSSAASDEL